MRIHIFSIHFILSFYPVWQKDIWLKADIRMSLDCDDWHEAVWLLKGKAERHVRQKAVRQKVKRRKAFKKNIFKQNMTKIIFDDMFQTFSISVMQEHQNTSEIYKYILYVIFHSAYWLNINWLWITTFSHST